MIFNVNKYKKFKFYLNRLYLLYNKNILRKKIN